MKAKMNKSVYLVLSMLEISKTLMFKFWWDYIKPKYRRNEKLSYMDPDNFIMHTKTDIKRYKDISNDVEKIVNTSNYELQCNSIEKPLTTGKNKKVLELMKDK